MNIYRSYNYFSPHGKPRLKWPFSSLLWSKTPAVNGIWQCIWSTILYCTWNGIHSSAVFTLLFLLLWKVHGRVDRTNNSGEKPREGVRKRKMVEWRGGERRVAHCRYWKEIRAFLVPKKLSQPTLQTQTHTHTHTHFKSPVSVSVTTPRSTVI